MPKYEMHLEEKKKLKKECEHWLLTRVFVHPFFRIGICVVPLIICTYVFYLTWVIFPWDELPRGLQWAPVFMTISAGAGTLFSCAIGIFGGKILLALEKNQKK